MTALTDTYYQRLCEDLQSKIEELAKREETARMLAYAIAISCDDPARLEHRLRSTAKVCREDGAEAREREWIAAADFVRDAVRDRNDPEWITELERLRAEQAPAVEDSETQEVAA